MLKIEVNKVKKEKKPELPKYPYFGVYTSDTMGKVVVLFTQDSSGMIIESGNVTYMPYSIHVNLLERKFKKIDNYSITIYTIN